MTRQQKCISELSDNDLLRKSLHTVEVNAYACCHKGKLNAYEQTLENDLKAELTARFLGRC